MALERDMKLTQNPVAPSLLGLIVLLASEPSAARAEEMVVVGLDPPAHSIHVALNSPIVVRFDRPVRRESFVPWRSF